VLREQSDQLLDAVNELVAKASSTQRRSEVSDEVAAVHDAIATLNRSLIERADIAAFERYAATE
jgi:hypothetical protein